MVMYRLHWIGNSTWVPTRFSKIDSLDKRFLWLLQSFGGTAVGCALEYCLEGKLQANLGIPINGTEEGD